MSRWDFSLPKRLALVVTLVPKISKYPTGTVAKKVKDDPTIIEAN